MNKIKYLYRLIEAKIRYWLSKNLRESVKMANAVQTVEAIIEKRCSVSRYGDGELNMIFNYQDNGSIRKSGFQKFDSKMGERLLEILQEGGSDECNHYVALPGCMFGIGTGYLKRNAATFWEQYSVKYLKRTIDLLDRNKIFLDTNFSRFYLSHKDKSRCREYIAHVKQIWSNRDVVIVEGEKTRLGVGNDLFESAKSIKRILCPATNAWDKYDEILSASTDYASENENVLFLCALGMTATVLAHDLAHKGYQAIDLGHIDIEYEWMLMGATEKVAVKNKFTNESKEGHISSELADEKYLSEIIAKI